MSTHVDETLAGKLNGLPMPCPLGDPLMFVGRVFKWLVAMALLLVVIAIPLIISDDGVDNEGSILAGALVLQAVALVLAFSLGIPDRTVNAIYLRNFRKDRESELVREHLEMALGPEFRLSGIRDPRKRINYFFRPFILIVMIIQYSSARYLGLEAEDDWKARIWASLAETRLLFIDLSVVTKYVEQEIRLCISSMPLPNIIFIVAGPIDEREWKEKFRAEFGLSAQQLEQLQLAVWQRADASTGAFIENVRQMISKADPEPEVRLADSYDQVSDSILTAKQRRSEQTRKWIKIGTGTILAFWALALMQEEFEYFPDPLSWVTVLVFAVFMAYVLIQLLVGIRVRHRRWKLARKFSPDDAQRHFIGLAKNYALFLLLLASVGAAAFNLGSQLGDEFDEFDDYEIIIEIEEGVPDE